LEMRSVRDVLRLYFVSALSPTAIATCPSSNYNFGRSPSDFKYLKSDHFEAL